MAVYYLNKNILFNIDLELADFIDVVDWKRVVNLYLWTSDFGEDFVLLIFNKLNVVVSYDESEVGGWYDWDLNRLYF